MDLTKNYHPLFPQKPDSPDDYEPEEFNKIQVVRLAAFGPLARQERGNVRCPRMYSPEELDSEVRFYDEFGGGSYDIQALRENGRFYQRRAFVLPGDSKPMAPDLSKTGQVGVGAAAPGGGGEGMFQSAAPGLDPMIALLMQLSSKSEERTMAMMANMMSMQSTMAAANAQAQAASLQAVMGVVAAVVGAAGNKDSTADLMRGYAEIVRSAQGPAGVSPMDALKSTLEGAKLIREEVEASRPPEPDQQDNTLKTVAEMAMPFVMKIAEGAASGAGAAAATPLFPAVP